MSRIANARTTAAPGSRIGAALFLIIGLVAGAIGLWWCHDRYTLIRDGSAAIGTVVGDGDGAAVASAHPTIEFTTAAGKRVQYRQNSMGERPVGARVPLLYHPAAPADTAVARDFWQFWAPPLVPVWIGFSFVGLILAGAKVEFLGR